MSLIVCERRSIGTAPTSAWTGAGWEDGHPERSLPPSMRAAPSHWPPSGPLALVEPCLLSPDLPGCLLPFALSVPAAGSCPSPSAVPHAPVTTRSPDISSEPCACGAVMGSLVATRILALVGRTMKRVQPAASHGSCWETGVLSRYRADRVLLGFFILILNLCVCS